MHVFYGAEFDKSHLGSDGESHGHSSHGYEWWYADGLSSDGDWGITLILFKSMPMSPDYLRMLDRDTDDSRGNAGWSVSVYHKRKRVYFDFCSPDLRASTDDCTEFTATVARVGMNGFTLDRSTDHVTLSTHIDTRPTSCNGRAARIRMEGISKLFASGEFSDSSAQTDIPLHGWVLTAPLSNADVSIELFENDRKVVDITVPMTVYRDHNYGLVPMQADFKRWFWGRVHVNDLAFVYLAATDATTPTLSVHVIHGNDVSPLRDVALRESRRRLSFMGIDIPRTVSLTGIDHTGSRWYIDCINEHIVENGPFYQRFISRWNVRGPGIVVEDVLGMSEVMDVKRLAKPWIRPFLRLPFHRPHIVPHIINV